MSAASKITFVLLLTLQQIHSDIIKCNNGGCSCSPPRLDGRDEECTLNCIESNICNDHTLTCREGDPCVIHCDAQSSCMSGTIVDGSLATDVTVICNEADSCKNGIDIHCGTGDCVLECNDKTSCDNWLDSVAVTNAQSFVCRGTGCPHSPSQALAGIPSESMPLPSREPTESPVDHTQSAILLSGSTASKSPSSAITILIVALCSIVVAISCLFYARFKLYIMRSHLTEFNVPGRSTAMSIESMKTSVELTRSHWDMAVVVADESDDEPEENTDTVPPSESPKRRRLVSLRRIRRALTFSGPSSYGKVQKVVAVTVDNKGDTESGQHAVRSSESPVGDGDEDCNNFDLREVDVPMYPSVSPPSSDDLMPVLLESEAVDYKHRRGSLMSLSLSLAPKCEVKGQRRQSESSLSRSTEWSVDEELQEDPYQYMPDRTRVRMSGSWLLGEGINCSVPIRLD